MKKILVLTMALMMFAGIVESRDFTISIPDGNLVADKTAFLAVHKNNEMIPDPEWINPEDGSEAPLINKYTDAEWIREYVRQHLKGQIERGYNVLHRNAQEKVDVVVE